MALYSITSAAAELGVNKSTVSRHVAKLELGTDLGGAVALTDADVAKLRKAIGTAKVGNPNFVAGNYFGKPPKKAKKSS